MARRRHIIEELEASIGEMRQTAIPVEEARNLATQVRHTFDLCGRRLICLY